MSTTFKLVVGEPQVLVPDTGANVIGSSSATGDKQMMLAILEIVGVVLATLLIVAVIRYRNKAKMGFKIKASKGTMVFRSLIALAALGGLGFGANFLYNVMAASDAVEVNTVTKGEVVINAELGDEAVVACGTDEVKLKQALPNGYVLSMKGTELAEVPAEDTDEGRGEAGEGETTDGETTDGETAEGGITLKYYLDNSETAGEISGDYTSIKTVTGVVEFPAEELAATIKVCAEVAPGTKYGTYTTTVDYKVEANTAQFSLSYDANGGSFAAGQAPETETTEKSIATSHGFTVTDKVPTPADPALHFYGWSLTGTSTSHIYGAGDEFTASAGSGFSYTLKAVYGYEEHTLTYNQNLVTTEDVDAMPTTEKCIVTVADSHECAVGIASYAPRTRGYTFLGWTNATEHTLAEGATLAEAQALASIAPGTVITISEDTTIYAVWWAVATNDYQAELRWGSTPQDVDAYLLAYRKSDGVLVGRVDFDHKTMNISDNGNEISASLDVDDRDGYGPEVITLHVTPLSAYSEYSFYYLINRYRDSEGVLRNSQARVVLTNANGETVVYDINTTATDATGDWWNVFAIINGEIVERNTITAEPDVNY